MKIIATDYDGTLNHNGFDESKLNAISQWRKKGNLFGIVSGRGVASIKDILSDKEFEYDYVIANNGAVICDADFNILVSHLCDGSICKDFINDLFGWGCSFVNVDSSVFFSVHKSAEDCEDEDEFTLHNMPEVSSFNQLSVALKDFTEAEAVVKKINSKYGNAFNPLQNGNCIDIVSIGVDKATGIYEYLKLVNGKYGDVITVGDNVNDEAMIKEFRSYAMESGYDYIKSIADYVTSGITELIEREI